MYNVIMITLVSLLSGAVCTGSLLRAILFVESLSTCCTAYSCAVLIVCRSKYINYESAIPSWEGGWHSLLFYHNRH